MKLKLLFTAICFLFSYFLFGQASTYVDSKGVFRWSKTDKEIRLFGVNYTLPFAHGFRAINYINKNHKQAIDKDIYHITRLGLDAYRVHIWDAEVTDSLGNLLNTPQLDLLDYTLAKLKERGIKTIVTPFKVGGNGYPEKDFPTEGFSSKLSKRQTYSDTSILEKQERYFTQLLNHVNPYTGIAYKNDKDIIALEINNEPRHDKGKIATTYINKMVKVIRDTGFKNPIFYNVSERSQFIDDYLKANIQGCTFQWYPTGLVHNRKLEGNYLPNVDRYNIPFSDKKAFKNKARIIYEFDAGDTNSSLLFPAMARSFREAKFQFATQFAYEPIELAYANTEYQTHYLNLAYTPSKAISIKIAGEAFREISNGKTFGRYPQNKTFLNTDLDLENEVAVYNSKTKFFYSNSTIKTPKAKNKLEQIAGVGSSELVKYSGNGAYFLDKVKNGIWRLEVLPDILWVKDPFEKASLDKTIAVIKNNKQKIKVDLADLTSNFSIIGLNKGNSFKRKTSDNQFSILPGTYLLYKNKLPKNFEYNQKKSNIKLDEFVTTNKKVDKIYIVHQPLEYIENGEDLQINLEAVAQEEIQKVEVVLPSGYQKTDNYIMTKKGVFSYEVTIPKEKIYAESFTYYIVVHTKNEVRTFPENSPKTPSDWDFIGAKKYKTTVVSRKPIVVLFDAVSTKNHLLYPNQWNAVKYSMNFSSSKIPSKKSLVIKTANLEAKVPNMTFKILLDNIIKNESRYLKNLNSVLVSASSGSKANQKVQVALQLKNGKTFGKTILLSSQMKDHIINFEDLKEVPLVLLPRPFPPFQPYFFEANSDDKFNAFEIEALQISIGPEIKKENFDEPQEVVINKIVLQ